MTRKRKRDRLALPSSDDFMVVHGQDPDAWARRYGLEPESVECHECGAEKRTTIPFFHGEYRGLMAPPCPCGSKSRTWCLVRAPEHGSLFYPTGPGLGGSRK